MAIPPVIPTPSTSPGPGSAAFPPYLKWIVSLIVIGGISEWLYKNVSPSAGYGLVAMVLLGYAATPGNITSLEQFFKDLDLWSEG